jgi:hypothetical protein
MTTYIYTVYDQSGCEVESCFTMQEAQEASLYFASEYPEYAPYHIDRQLVELN